MAPGPDESAWRTLQHTPLGEEIWLVVWFGAAVTPEPGLTLALGMREDGRRQILGLWTGLPDHVRCAQQLVDELHDRGLGRGGPWLAVTGGARALDQALRDVWGAQVRIAHCQRQAVRQILAHLPPAAQADARRALLRAWDGPHAEAAVQQLESLAESWRTAHPGAAERLRRAIPGTTAVLALGVHGGLVQRLRTTAPADYLLDVCRHGGRYAPALVAAELLRRQAAFRRPAETYALAALRQALTEAAQQPAGSLRAG